MFFMKVHQHLLLVMVMTGGIVTTLAILVGALDMRRGRAPGEMANDPPLLPTRSAIPWFIIFSNIVILALGIIYTVATILTPPNW
jgi:hypothetical protein